MIEPGVLFLTAEVTFSVPNKRISNLKISLSLMVSVRSEKQVCSYRLSCLNTLAMLSMYHAHKCSVNMEANDQQRPSARHGNHTFSDIY